MLETSLALPERAAVDENESQNCCFVRPRLSSSDLFWSEEKAPPVDVTVQCSAGISA